MIDEPGWYRHAIFYELLVRAFQDGNGDGIGDFPGLISRLDYLQWLGVTCIWLLPFNTSPLRDGGYDVSDYLSVLPEFGNVEDVRRLLKEAHARGMRVIMDLVMNHTSDQHPWFQAARSSPDSPFRDYYVWSDTNTRYADARIIFLDTEGSNWSWDDTAGAYYWHRFYSHQPDLNYDNPAVPKAMLDVARFWLDMGMDGFRLDAVPYLYERENTNCENLPQTHEFLASLRAMVDREYPDRVLLSEANQWPEDVVEYFGTADRPECHMNFQFPIMPRLFMALRMGSCGPLVSILERTPDVPPGCQWGIFLRNHDELTLEMVTEDERQYMWAEYAPQPRMRLNLGIRRRLAPLLDDDRRKIELLFALLLSLPGTPILYYGDEIGMGDDIDLPDRDGVRTPMQWSIDSNAGFSTADPSNLYLPVIADPTYSYQTVNVEAQRQDMSSLLNWVRSTLALRSGHRVFGEGDMRIVEPDNDAVFAFLRSLDGVAVLCVNNLSDTTLTVSLDLAHLEGRVPVDIGIGSRLLPIGTGGYPLSVSPYGFHWYNVESS